MQKTIMIASWREIFKREEHCFIGISLAQMFAAIFKSKIKKNSEKQIYNTNNNRLIIFERKFLMILSKKTELRPQLRAVKETQIKKQIMVWEKFLDHAKTHKK